MNKETFELAYRRYMEDGGHSYDPFDIIFAWKEYQKSPDKYSWLSETGKPCHTSSCMKPPPTTG